MSSWRVSFFLQNSFELYRTSNDAVKQQILNKIGEFNQTNEFLNFLLSKGQAVPNEIFMNIFDMAVSYGISNPNTFDYEIFAKYSQFLIRLLVQCPTRTLISQCDAFFKTIFASVPSFSEDIMYSVLSKLPQSIALLPSSYFLTVNDSFAESIISSLFRQQDYFFKSTSCPIWYQAAINIILSKKNVKYDESEFKTCMEKVISHIDKFNFYRFCFFEGSLQFQRDNRKALNLISKYYFNFITKLFTIMSDEDCANALSLAKLAIQIRKTTLAEQITLEDLSTSVFKNILLFFHRTEDCCRILLSICNLIPEDDLKRYIKDYEFNDHAPISCKQFLASHFYQNEFAPILFTDDTIDEDVFYFFQNNKAPTKYMSWYFKILKVNHYNILLPLYQENPVKFCKSSIKLISQTNDQDKLQYLVKYLMNLESIPVVRSNHIDDAFIACSTKSLFDTENASIYFYFLQYLKKCEDFMIGKIQPLSKLEAQSLPNIKVLSKKIIQEINEQTNNENNEIAPKENDVETQEVENENEENQQVVKIKKRRHNTEEIGVSSNVEEQPQVMRIKKKQPQSDTESTTAENEEEAQQPQIIRIRKRKHRQPNEQEDPHEEVQSAQPTQVIRVRRRKKTTEEAASEPKEPAPQFIIIKKRRKHRTPEEKEREAKIKAELLKNEEELENSASSASMNELGTENQQEIESYVKRTEGILKQPEAFPDQPVIIRVRKRKHRAPPEVNNDTNSHIRKRTISAVQEQPPKIEIPKDTKEIHKQRRLSQAKVDGSTTDEESDTQHIEPGNELGNDGEGDKSTMEFTANNKEFEIFSPKLISNLVDDNNEWKQQLLTISLSKVLEGNILNSLCISIFSDDPTPINNCISLLKDNSELLSLFFATNIVLHPNIGLKNFQVFINEATEENLEPRLKIGLLTIGYLSHFDNIEYNIFYLRVILRALNASKSLRFLVTNAIFALCRILDGKRINVEPLIETLIDNLSRQIIPAIVEVLKITESIKEQTIMTLSNLGNTVLYKYDYLEFEKVFLDTYFFDKTNIIFRSSLLANFRNDLPHLNYLARIKKICGFKYVSPFFPYLILHVLNPVEEERFITYQILSIRSSYDNPMIIFREITNRLKFEALVFILMNLFDSFKTVNKMEQNSVACFALYTILKEPIKFLELKSMIVPKLFFLVSETEDSKIHGIFKYILENLAKTDFVYFFSQILAVEPDPFFSNIVLTICKEEELADQCLAALFTDFSQLPLDEPNEFNYKVHHMFLFYYMKFHLSEESSDRKIIDILSCLFYSISVLRYVLDFPTKLAIIRKSFQMFENRINISLLDMNNTDFEHIIADFGKMLVMFKTEVVISFIKRLTILKNTIYYQAVSILAASALPYVRTSAFPVLLDLYLSGDGSGFEFLENMAMSKRMNELSRDQLLIFLDFAFKANNQNVLIYLARNLRSELVFQFQDKFLMFGQKQMMSVLCGKLKIDFHELKTCLSNFMIPNYVSGDKRTKTILKEIVSNDTKIFKSLYKLVNDHLFYVQMTQSLFKKFPVANTTIKIALRIIRVHTPLFQIKDRESSLTISYLISYLIAAQEVLGKPCKKLLKGVIKSQEDGKLHNIKALLINESVLSKDSLSNL